MKPHVAKYYSPKGEARPLPMRRFRMAQLELFSLQSGAGVGNAVEPAVLALPDSAPRQISRGICRAHGKRSGAADGGRRGLAERARHLGARGFGRRGARRSADWWSRCVGVSRGIACWFRPRPTPGRNSRASALAKRTYFTFRWTWHSRSGRICGRCKPELVVLAETEFWPNFLRLAHASGARIAVVNARISDRSWPRYRRFRWALRRMLVHVDLFLAQTAEDSARLQSIGAEAGRVQVTGNLKFDVSLPAPPPIVESLRQVAGGGGRRAGAGLRQHGGRRGTAAAEGV